MGSTPLRLAGVVLGLGALVAPASSSHAAPRSAAQATGPTITVSPSDGLVDEQMVEVELTGLSGDVQVSQCAPDLVDTSRDPVSVAFVHCRNQVFPDASSPLVVPFTVDEAYTTNYRGNLHTTRCGGAGPDCLLVAFGTGSSTLLTTPIHFGPPRPEPAITVTPSSGLHAGDVVQVEVVGFGGERLFEVGQCESDVLDAPDPGSLILSGSCGPLSGGNAWDDPWTGSVTIAEAWTSGSGDSVVGHRCRDEPGSCVILVYAPESGALLAVPVDVDPSPLVLVPADQEAGFQVHAFVTGQPGATVRLAQCAEPVRARLGASQCSTAQSITLDGRGEALVPLEVVDEIAARRRPHRPVRCSVADCAVAVFSRAGRRIASAPIVVHAADGPPEMSVEPFAGLVDGQDITVTLTGVRNEWLWLGQCDASVAETGDVDGGPCHEVQVFATGRDQPTLTTSWPAVAAFTAPDGRAVDCGAETGACVVALETGAGHVVTVPISFAPPGSAP